MNFVLSFIFLSVLLLLFEETTQASSSPTYASTAKFITGQSQQYLGTISYPRPSTGAFTDLAYSVSYPTALSGVKYTVALGICDLKTKSPETYMLKFTIHQTTTTGFVMNVSASSGGNLQSNVLLTYLTVDPSFPQPFTIGFHLITPTTAYRGPCQVSLVFNFTQESNLSFVTTNNNAILLYQHHINLKAQDNDFFNVQVNPTILNSTHYQIKVVSYYAVNITNLGISRIIFDKTAIQSKGQYYLTYGQTAIRDDNFTVASFTTNPYFSNNFMIGLRNYNISHCANFFFNTVKNISTTFQADDTDYLNFPYLSIKVRSCPVAFPYFIASTFLCYDICPDGLYGDTVTKTCLPCHYSCKTCSAFSTCTSCESLNNRYLNGTSCLPNTGYFDNGTAVAVLCSTALSNCTACSNNVTCTQCQSGYVLDSTSKCVLCSGMFPNCDVCTTSPVSCSLCKSGYILNSTGGCSLCSVFMPYCSTCTSTSICSTCANPYVVALNGTICASTTCVNTFCATCSIQNTNVCYTCTVAGYYIVSQTCVTRCGDGIKVGTEQCDDGNTADGDGCNADCTTGNNNGCPASTPYRDPTNNQCSSTCPNRYYVNVTAYLCSPCYYTCLTCSNSSGCLSCSSTSNRALSGTQCLPNPGFYDDSTSHNAILCVSPCLNCISVSSCLSCVSGFYLSGTSCLSCSGAIPYCQNCTSATACTSCQFGFFFVAASGQCSPLTCDDVNCALCVGSVSICTQCIVGYQVDSGRCRTVCGDGARAGTQQCDDHNLVDGDGCNKDCTFGNNNNCSAASPYRDPVSGLCSSVCPAKYYPNPAAYSCQPCFYTCFTCTNSSDCTSCSASSNRYQSGSQCLPMSGYYDLYPNYNASACVSPCLTCTSASTCLTCVNGYYFSVSSCLHCSNLLDGCSNCTSTVCSACQQGYVFNSALNTCQIITCTELNCHLCMSSSSACIECIVGYQIDSGQCRTVCGDGARAGTQQCDDHNLVDGDGCNKDCTFGNNNNCSAASPYRDPVSGLCSSVCPAKYYPNPAAYSCQPCFYTCFTCTNSSDCTSCSASSNRYQSGSQCLPMSGYYDLYPNYNASACVSPCLTCTSTSTCSNCIVGYFLLSSSCSSCPSSIPNCLTCSSGSLCTICSVGYVINVSTGFCDLIVCADANCISCLASVSICTQCIIGYQVDSGRCRTVCGDGVLAGTQQCDDNNLVDGDGCNKDCTFGNNNNCSAASPYKDPVSGLCSSVCPNRYYPNPTAYSCEPCFYTCFTCTNSSDCTSCSSSSNRYQNGSQCLPMSGHYDQYPNYYASFCYFPCLTCTSQSFCLTCVTGYYYQNDMCLLCQSVIPFCTSCSSPTLCLDCELGYFANSSTGLCDRNICADTNCLICLNPTFGCESCSQGYEYRNGQCASICGDNFKTTNQQCDDGNLEAKDGCSATCQIESNFTCELSTQNYEGSTCYYTGQVKVWLISMDKIDGQNKISVTLGLSPTDFKYWKDVNFIDMIELNSPVPITDVTISRNPDGTVAVEFKYQADIQGTQIQVKLDPANTGIPALMRATPTSQSMVIEPKDNKTAYYYEDQYYQLAEMTTSLGTAIGALAIVFFLIGLAYGKVIAVEMAAVIQITYLSVVTLNQTNPCIAALTSLKFSNGFNFVNSFTLLGQSVPAQVKQALLSPMFAQNYNFSALLVLIPLLVALISFILSKTVAKENQKVELIFRKSIGEYTLNGLVFSGYIIGISFALEISYGIKNTHQLVGVVSLAECIVFLLMIVVYLIFLIVKPEYFGQYVEYFKNEKLSSKFYSFMLIQRLFVGCCLIFMLSVNMEAVVPVIVYVLIAGMVLIKKPYKRNYHNYRFVANMAIASLIEVLFIVMRMSKQVNSPIFMFLPLVICVLLLVCVGYSVVAIFYEIYNALRKKEMDEQMEKEDLEEINKLRNETQCLNMSSSRDPQTSIRQGLVSPIKVRPQINVSHLKSQILSTNSANLHNPNQNPNINQQAQIINQLPYQVNHLATQNEQYEQL